MQGVMRVLVQKSKSRIIDATAAKVAEIVQAQYLSYIIGGRIVIVNLLVDGLTRFVFGGVAQWIPQRV